MNAFATDVRQQLRVLLLLLRPALVLLMLSFALLGLAVGGRPQDLSLVVPVSLTVLGFLLVAVSVNDLSDREVDRLNLPGAASRPLSTGLASHRDMVVTAVVGGVTALACASWLGAGPLLVAAAGLALALAYSVEPLSLSRRGAAASLILPAGFVGVPYGTALLATHCSLTSSSLILPAGLYVGFIGRILLKDFRDVVGDTLIGKRTFLVRHGRVVTCRLSAAFWLAGSAMVLCVSRGSAPLYLSYGLEAGWVLFLLGRLGRCAHPRQDEALVAAIAILGRGCVAALLGHYTLLARPGLESAVQLGLLVTTLLSAWAMAAGGPVTRSFVPASFSTVREDRELSVSA